VLRQLKSAGLDAIAEAPIDRLADPFAALREAEEAGLPVKCLSLQKPLQGSRTEYVLKVRNIVERFPALQTVAPLPREQSIAVPTTGYDDVRAVALTRLGLPMVRNIQVDWTQYGPKLAQVALTFGANDLDRVSSLDDESLGRRRTSVEDVRRNIAAAGFTAAER
jgi:2-iminoacetate synthase ThiH